MKDMPSIFFFNVTVFVHLKERPSSNSVQAKILTNEIMFQSNQCTLSNQIIE